VQPLSFARRAHPERSIVKIFVPKETTPGELRVAMIPSVVRKFAQNEFVVEVETGAGSSAFLQTQNTLKRAPALLPTSRLAAAVRTWLRQCVHLDHEHKVCPKNVSQFPTFRRRQTRRLFLRSPALLPTSRLSFDLVPRISRAQSMDALTSQALVAGYRAALVAAEKLPSFFPLFMTDAGTIQPAKVLVLGAGVAGLQAIATAKRLGAKVSAYDVRPASADEVKSMGAALITLDLDALVGEGGYAREMSEDRATRQRELLTPYIAASDAVITTAAVPGRTAPLLVTREMVETMHPGSVVVDLASETGGNVEGSRPGEVVEMGGVFVWGAQDVASSMPVHASQLYAMNVLALSALLINEGSIMVDLEDEILDGCAVVVNGEIRNKVAREALGVN